MSFNLPRNAKDLRFTGELRAAVDEQPRGKLGIPRARRTPQPGQSAHARDVYQAEPIPTPYAPPPIAVLNLEDDESPTTMLDRDGLDIVAGGFAGVGVPAAGPQAGGFGAPKQKAPEAKPSSPVPNFRTPVGMPSVIVAPDSRPRTPAQPKTPPLAFWLVAALVLGIASYRVAPLAIRRADHAVRVLQPR